MIWIYKSKFISLSLYRDRSSRWSVSIIFMKATKNDEHMHPSSRECAHHEPNTVLIIFRNICKRLYINEIYLIYLQIKKAVTTQSAQKSDIKYCPETEESLSMVLMLDNLATETRSITRRWVRRLFLRQTRHFKLCLLCLCYF